MSEEIKVPKTTVMPTPEVKTSKAPWIILAVIVVVLAVLGLVFRGQIFGKKTGSMGSGSAKTANYQAVFLTNGQVYFGKISNPEGEYVNLKDIYYLQVGPQQGSTQGGTDQPAQQPGQTISLVKLGNELHGPEDEMHINRAQILFYEDLKESGQVVAAILQDKAAQANPTPAAK
jgi:hypothetical protein